MTENNDWKNKPSTPYPPKAMSCHAAACIKGADTCLPPNRHTPAFDCTAPAPQGYMHMARVGTTYTTVPHPEASTSKRQEATIRVRYTIRICSTITIWATSSTRNIEISTHSTERRMVFYIFCHDGALSPRGTARYSTVSHLGLALLGHVRLHGQAGAAHGVVPVLVLVVLSLAARTTR